ncbi:MULTISPECIES: tetratricopeptide repeat protein [unclassified Marinovum]
MSALKRMFLAPCTAALLAPALIPSASVSAPLELAFLPPTIEQQSLCGTGLEERTVHDGSPGQDDRLTDLERVRYLQRDIRRFQSKDPDRFFDFVADLRKRLTAADASFGGPNELIDMIGLHIDAGRVLPLEQAGLVQQLLDTRDTLNNAQRMRLALFLLQGVGTQPDETAAFDLIREAAFGGHPEALLFIARRLAEDRPLPGWDAPQDLTATMAFGGLLGQMDGRVCARAERIAEEYLSGGILRRNPELGRAWYRFAADLGSARASWRMVEFHLSAGVNQQDNAEMLHYLRRAVSRGIVVDDAAQGQLKAGGIDADTLREILAFNQSDDRGRQRPSLTGLLRLNVNIDAEETSLSGPHLIYLREIVALPSAPGAVFTDLAQELQVRIGRWAGEDEIMAQLEIATNRDDPEGMRLLARKLLRYRDDPSKLNRAIDLLTRAATRHRDAPAMDALDTLFRCQAPNAPLLENAAPWARAYRATGHDTVSLSATNLLALDPFKDPWRLARLQAQALSGRPTSLANYLQLVQVDPLATETRQRLWADRTDNSDKTLEEFAKLEFELATNPAERALALEFFRRVYLNNGVTSALDLSVAMINDNGMSPDMAAEVRTQLRQASHRGEGAAIRLLARLGKEADAEQQVFDEFAQIIDDRGDFLAMMFALPYVTADKRDDYFDRAASEMNCTTKDTDEMGEAHAIHGNADMSFHWREIGLTIEGHNTLSRLRLTNGQMEGFDTQAAPTASAVAERDLGADTAALWRLFALTGSPDLSGYDPETAASQFKALAQIPGTMPRAFEQYLATPPELRAAIDHALDFKLLLAKAAQAGDPDALWRQARLLQSDAGSIQALAEAVTAVRAAALAGSVPAMTQYGRALALGLGITRDDTEALEWLDKAATAKDPDAAELARWLRLR